MAFPPLWVCLIGLRHCHMAHPLCSPLTGPVRVTRVALLIRSNQIKLWQLLQGLAERRAFLECALRCWPFTMRVQSIPSGDMMSSVAQALWEFRISGDVQVQKSGRMSCSGCAAVCQPLPGIKVQGTEMAWGDAMGRRH